MKKEEEPSMKNINNLNYTRMAKTKTLTIEIKETEEETATRFKSKGLTDFEIIGLLSYYLDAYKVRMLRSPEIDLKLKDNE